MGRAVAKDVAAGPSMVYASARDVEKVYPSPKGDVVALRGMDLEIRDREFMSVLGPSGCGKSTFLRCVAGLTDVTGGDLTVKGAAVTGPPAGMGIVFQRDILLDWRSNIENVLLPIDFRRLNRREWEPRARDLFRQMGLFGRSA